MANGLADTKVALGFAGVVIAIAVVGALSMDYIVPAIQGNAAEEQVVETAPETAPSPAPQAAPVATTWADDASVADDWGAAAASTPNNARGFTGDSEGGEGQIEGNFADFSPQSSGNSSAPSTVGSRPSRSSAGGSGSQRVTSGAAPEAPPLQPPGGRTVGR